MAIIIPNQFTSYALTDKELLEGAKLTTLQKQFLQNQLSNAAMEKNALEFDPNNQLKFAQQEASLKGQMDAFTFLLDSSLAAEEETNEASITL